MMKAFIGFAIFICMNTPVQSQNTVRLTDEVIDERWPGGQEALVAFIYSLIRYPRASRENCEMGEIFVKVVVDENGEVNSINFVKPSWKPLQKEVTRILELTNGRWIPKNERSEFLMSFGFELGHNEEIQGDMKVTAIPVFGNSECPLKEDLEKKLSKYLEKKKFKRARKYCNELLFRYPRESKYRETMSIIESNL